MQTTRTAEPRIDVGKVAERLSAARAALRRRPLLYLVIRRLPLAVVTLLIVAVLVFAATMVLPGNAAQAVLGTDATPESLRALEQQLGLDQSVGSQFWSWFSGLLTGDLGTSLSDGSSVASIVGPRTVNSLVLAGLAGLIGSLLGVTLGVLAAAKRDSPLDHALSVCALAVTALPEFVVAIALVIVFSTVVLNVLPAVSMIPPGANPWDDPQLLVLPVATLVIVITPYIFRMARAAMIEALESEYVAMARLKGMPPARVLAVHALPNAIPPTVQVVGLAFLYLAGGIVVVEFLFAYPGLGEGLVAAVSNRDIPVIQCIVLILATFYVLMNILTDVIAMMAAPRRRLPRDR